jgi:DNA-binding CsgD family transcriptional regulator
LGVIELDLLALPTARQHLEQTLALANTMGSMMHSGITRAYLILVDIGQKEWSKAEHALQSQLPPDLPMQTINKRFLWHARAELALAQGDAHLALQLIDRLFMTAANAAGRPISAIPYLAYLRGRALTALQRWTEAEATFQTTLATAHVQETSRLLWRIRLALGQLYQTQALLPAPHLVTPRPAAKASDGGLTRREREVAALIATGKSNRAIAEALVIGERTVEGHVGNLLGKLGFTSRAQISVWAVEKGLTKQ